MGRIGQPKEIAQHLFDTGVVEGKIKPAEFCLASASLQA
jgi:hypothetical protein